MNETLFQAKKQGPSRENRANLVKKGTEANGKLITDWGIRAQKRGGEFVGGL